VGSYALLSLSTSADPVSGPSEAYVDGTELQFKYGVPIGWIALFNQGDFVSKVRYEEKDDYEFPELFLVTPISRAMETLKDRESALSQALGEPWNEGLSLFFRYLSNSSSSHVHLDLTEYMELVGGPKETQISLGEWIETVSRPYHTGRIGLFSRKPIVDGAWRRLIRELPSCKKHADDYAVWMFGWREDIERACSE